MTPKEKILQRIREALSVPTHDTFLHSRSTRGPSDFRDHMVPVGPSLDERVTLFEAYSEKLKTEFHRVPSVKRAGDLVREWSIAQDWNLIASHDHDLTRPLVEAAGCEALWISEGYDRNQLEQAQVGLTTCEALVAQTGGVLVTSAGCGGRALSVLPPHHIVIATADQLLPDLYEALELMETRYGHQFPSMMSMITGPSRTGDIERILVLGAHGPKRLSVILVG